MTEQGDEEFEDGEERGRVFVKVIGVKDLDLPLPKSMCTGPTANATLTHLQMSAHGSN